MNKHLLLLCSLLYSGGMVAENCCSTEPSCVECCDCKVSAHSFFSTRPQYQTGSPERMAGFWDRAGKRTNGHGGALEFTVFGGRSTSSGKLATYFTPFCKAELVVKEAEPIAELGVNAPFRFDGDIRATTFNIATLNGNFESKIRFAPHQTVFGVGLTYTQEFARNEDTNKGFWFTISTPLEYVKNTLGFSETIVNDGGGAVNDQVVGSMTDAFQQSTWNYGRIGGSLAASSSCDGNSCSSSSCSNSNSCCSSTDSTNKSRCCSMSKTRLADIDLQLGYNCVNEEDYKLGSYIGILIPTGNKVQGVNLFEPIVGHNKHFGINGGYNLGLKIWENEENDRTIWGYATFHIAYLVSNKQIRSFDLKGKPWSRYMEVYKDQDQVEQVIANPLANIFLHTPGINVFTQEVRVHPEGQATLNLAGVYTSGKFKGEFGYNCFCRAAECVELTCPWKEGPALKSTGGNTNDALIGATDRGQTINDHLGHALAQFAEQPTTLASYQENLIKESDLDLQSAAHPGVLSHTFYGSLGANWDDREYPVFATFGGSYEFGTSNMVMDRWLLWAKAGFSF